MNPRFWLKLVVSAGLLAWLLARTPLPAVLHDLDRIGATVLLGGALLSLLSWLVAALRLWCLAPEFSLAQIFRMSFIAQFYTIVLPGQLAGDAVKIWRLGRFEQTPGQAAAATLVDRGVATLALFAIGAVAAWATPIVPFPLRLLMLAVVPAIAVVGCLLASTATRDLLVALSRHGMRRPWLWHASALLQRMAHALHDALRRPRRLLDCLLLALVFHAICIANHVLIAHALGIDIGFWAFSLIYAGVSLLMLLPISLAGIGLREGGYVGLLVLFGIGREAALALSFVFLGFSLFGALLGFVIEQLEHRET